MTQPASLMPNQHAAVLMPNQIHSIATSQRQQALDLTASFQSRVDSVSRNADLTQDAKHREIATSYVKTKAVLDQLRADEAASLDARKSDLHRSLFGQYAAGNAGPAHVITIRDAEDRASKLEDPDDAAAQLARAHRNGDSVLVKAIASQAHENGWQSVTAAYSEINPAAAGQLDELNTLHFQQNDTRATLGTAFAFGLPVPTGIPQGAIAAAAAEAGVRL